MAFQCRVCLEKKEEVVFVFTKKLECYTICDDCMESLQTHFDEKQERIRGQV